jgi:glycosyltransferase involved in cell wall biosynthesis
MDGVVFVGHSADASFYHRVMLPATALGCDWCGLDSPPPRMTLGRGEVRFGPDGPDLGSYRVVVVQTTWDEGWLELVRELRAGGTAVLCDADYFLPELIGDDDVLTRIETFLGACDGVLCATAPIAAGYARHNARTFVCENGIDLKAYALTRPDHDTVNIGWAGTSAPPEEMLPWAGQIAAMMRVRDVTNFVSIGQRLGDAVAGLEAVAPERCLSIPGVLPEQYPAAMSIFDIAFDPAGMDTWRLGRSQLRWLEAGAWGIPFVGDPRIYRDVEDGVTGFHATEPVEMARTILRLVDDPLLRASVGGKARQRVAERHSMEAVVPQWLRAFEAVVQ